MAAPFDALVIGAGHNGLCAALTLAQSKRRVLVLEGKEQVGGLCAGREFHPGYQHTGLLPDTATFRPELAQKLGLAAHGLRFVEREPGLFVGNSQGSGLLLDERLADLSLGGAEAYGQWKEFISKVGKVLRRQLDAAPPPLDPRRASEYWNLGKTGLEMRRLGKQSMTELLRVLPMCAADWLQERFENQLLCAALAAPAVLASFTGPWAAGTAGHLLMQRCSSDRSIVGGPAGLTQALLSACLAAGIEIRRSAKVERIMVGEGQVRGVQLAGGESIEAKTVLASCDPKQALLGLVGPRFLDATTEQDLRSFRCRGSTAILHLAVEGSVELGAKLEQSVPQLRLAGDNLDDLERVFDAVKYRRCAESPYIEVRIPSLLNPSLAPQGGHVLTAWITGAPYDLTEGWTDEAREALSKSAIQRLTQHLPGIQDGIVDQELLTPTDLEKQYALPGGHLYHGEHALDQLLFLRPSLQLAQYRTPIGGLFLGGSGNHPGGGITGMPGHLAARTALTKTK